MLEHGGKLRDAVKRYSIPYSKWIDLSTGINPNGWQAGKISDNAWNRLPEIDDGLLEAAQEYYGCESLLPVAGSQAAIQALPGILSHKKNVGVLSPTYAEHAHAWKLANHNVVSISSKNIEKELPNLDILIIVNPNNPTGELSPPQTLINWQEQLASKNGWLIVDEAFMDCSQQYSMLPYVTNGNLIIFRSIGKFFGLAGIRVGFVAAPQYILDALNQSLGPWTISGPSRECAQQALTDRNWQSQNRESLYSSSKYLNALLTARHLKPSGSTHLFSWVETPQAKEIHEELARAGILTRLFTEPDSIRFGLPANDYERDKLDHALKKVMRANS